MENKKMLSYTSGERNSYLMGMAGQNIIYGIISSGLAFYFSSVIALPAIAISIIMAIARVWDAINDPIMGTFVDRTNTKWGKCRPYLIVMPLVIMIITILCFANGIYSTANQVWMNVLIIAWAGISYIIWGMLYTAADIPLWGIASLMTADEKKRANLLSLARMVAGIGGALGFVMVPIGQALANIFNEKLGWASSKSLQIAFIIVAIVLSVLGTIMFQFAAKAKEHVRNEAPVEKVPVLKSIANNFKTMWRNKPYRKLLISGVIRSPFQLLLILAMPLMTYYFGDNGKTFNLLSYGAIAVGVFGGQFGAMALTPLLCKKFEKKNVFNMANLVSGIAFAMIFVLYLIWPHSLQSVGPLLVLALCFLVASAGVGFVMVLQSMMIADCVDQEEYVSGIRPDGVFFSGQSFVTKLSAGIAVLIQGVVYSIVNFQSDNMLAINESLMNGVYHFSGTFARPYAEAMFLLVAIPPAIGMLLSIIPMLKYELTDKEHTRILDELNVARLAKLQDTVYDTLEEAEELLANDGVNSEVEAEAVANLEKTIEMIDSLEELAVEELAVVKELVADENAVTEDVAVADDTTISEDTDNSDESKTE